MSALIALADPARWRLISLLAERPRPVGVLAGLAEARQPQTSKHLQTLEHAGIVASHRDGQRRVYALRPEVLRELAAAFTELADTADRRGSLFETHDRYMRSVDLEQGAARGEGWADGRTFTFTRSLPGSRSLIWRHLTEQALLAEWWTPDGLRLSRLEFSPRAGAGIVQEYRDAEDLDGSDEMVGRAEGVIDQVDAEERLVYRMWPLLPDGSRAFTAHVELRLTPSAGSGTDLIVDYLVTESAAESADFIAGIEIGFGQSLDRLGGILSEATAHAGDEDYPRH